MDIIVTLLIVTLAAVVVVPLLLYRLTVRQFAAESERLLARLDQSLSAPVKLLEVREYYAQTQPELKRMLDEAHKDGNRFRQEQVRKLIERLETLKVRALDKTLSVLQQQQQPSDRSGNRRRHRGGRRFHRPPGQGGGQQQQPPAPPSPPAQ